MKTKYDLTNAQALVEEYCAGISNPDTIPTKYNRCWLEFAMERLGIIPNVRALGLFESHVIWYACLVVTGNVRRVTRLEGQFLFIKPGCCTETTIRKMLKGQSNSIGAPVLREILANTAVAA